MGKVVGLNLGKISKLTLISLFVSAIFALAACSNPKEPSGGEFSELANEATEIQESMNRGNLFKSSSTRDKTKIEDLLYEIKVTCLYLQQHPDSEAAYQRLKIALKEFDEIQVLSRDNAQINAFLGKVYSVANKTALAHGIKLENFGWALFSYRFSGGVAPFASLPSATSWEAAWGLDESYVKAKGYGNDSWLVSPTFDLSRVRDPGVLVNHTILLDRNNKVPDVFDRATILKESFLLLASTNYKPGDDPKDPSIVWHTLDFKTYPNSYDFHYVESPLIDLSGFEGQKVTLAFRLNLDSNRNGRHYPTWQIKKFELIGQGDLGEVEVSAGADPSLLRIDAKRDSLTPFQQLTYIPVGGQWTPGTGGGKTFLKAGSQEFPSESWLFTPIFKIRDQERLILQIGETVKSPMWSNWRVLVSADYKGGDPALATWTDTLRKEPTVTSSDFTDLVTTIDMAPYRDQDVVFAFKFTDPGGDGARIWEILYLDFLGEGSAVDTEKLSPAPSITEATP